MNAINNAYSGMQASTVQLNASASRIAHASAQGIASSMPAAQPVVQPATQPGGVDLALELVSQLDAKQSFEANVSVLQRARDAEQSLFELWA